MSDSVRPHKWQPMRLRHPWDSPGKNTGVGCHFLLQCMKVKSESEVAQSCQTRSDPMNCSPQAPPSMGSFRQEYWSGVPLPSPRKMFFPFLSFLLYLYEKMDTCCCCSVAQSFLTLFAPMGCSMLGFPVLHLLEFAQAHVH